MNFDLQKKKLEFFIQKKGLDKDTIDLHSHIDRTLRYGENKRLISKKFNIGRSFQPITTSQNRLTYILEAQDINDKRKQKSQYYDRNKVAKKTFYQDSITTKQFNKWKKKPNQYDIDGIDNKSQLF
jgi:hypothetical protein